MSDWLDLMLDEIQRKRQEREAAAEEQARRNSPPETPDESVEDQSK
ncbi:MAG: hypothetical protein AAF660_01030 [Pseudomonadota bacterium]